LVRLQLGGRDLVLVDLHDFARDKTCGSGLSPRTADLTGAQDSAMRRLETVVHETDPDIGLHEPSAPVGVEIRGGLCGDDFVARPARSQHRFDAIADGREHALIPLEIGPRRERSVPGDDARFPVAALEDPHPPDVSADAQRSLE
jgi:hypothetical protein